MRDLLDKHLGPAWLSHADQPQTWGAVADIPAAELWAARCAARAQLVDMIMRRAIGDRLRRGEPLDYASAATGGFHPARLTIGFARRLATYKRLHLVGLMPERAIALVGGRRPVQFVFAGKAHPNDHEAKDVVRRLFELKRAPGVAGRAAFLEDYDIPLAGHLVAGCDVWVNLPRPPQEASGTSGMKSVLGGGLQLSVLDGWWAEAYDGHNGWAIDGSEHADHGAQDWRDANTLFDLLEQQVVPMFHERGADGVPRRWVDMMRRSLMTNGPRFSATRMVREYAERIYRRS
jgi:starch phosphorylase